MMYQAFCHPGYSGDNSVLNEWVYPNQNECWYNVSLYNRIIEKNECGYNVSLYNKIIENHSLFSSISGPTLHYVLYERESEKIFLK